MKLNYFLENASLDTQVCHPSQDSELNHQEEIANMQKDHENEVNNVRHYHK